ncbi:MAG: pdtaR [Anaerolineales bacterium]|jgi:response regulator NasT|nr:pdtaR [Anaerolineales bacterium]MBM2848199.1 pdtaR [Anaerolineales bacterium]
MRRLKILVADDEAIIRLGLRTMLTELGHEVVLASNGREALEFVRTARPDLALLDIQMPLTDGLEAARVIARKHPMPILILTAYGEQDLIERAAQLPIQGYLVKPVNERDLAAAIQVAVARFEDAQAQARENAELKESLEARKLVERAKGVLMKTGLSEEEAYLAIQRQAREARVSMRQAAEAIIAQAQPKSPA